MRPENHVWVNITPSMALPETILCADFSNKAVSDGAISFYLDHYVRSRIAKITYGVHTRIKFDSSDPEHLERSSMVYTDLAGTLRLGKGFGAILLKVRYDPANKKYPTADNKR